jgi:hypothetical protein
MSRLDTTAEVRITALATEQRFRAPCHGRERLEATGPPVQESRIARAFAAAIRILCLGAVLSIAVAVGISGLLPGIVIGLTLLVVGLAPLVLFALGYMLTSSIPLPADQAEVPTESCQCGCDSNAVGAASARR